MGDLQPVRLRDIRVDRSTLQRSLSSSKIDEGISHFCFGMVRIGFCLSKRSRADRRFPLLLSLSHQHIESRSTSVYRQFPTDLFVSDGLEYIVVHRLDFGEVRSGTPPLATTSDILRCSGSRLPYRAQGHTSTLLAASTAHYPCHTLETYRTELAAPTSAECLPGSTVRRFETFFLLSFLCLEVLEV